MDILIDTNVILDHLCSRQPYAVNVGKILRLCFQRDCKGYIDALNDKEFSDLEDRIQFECAQIINAHYIITRNIADFPNSPIPVILPEDFLKIIDKKNVND
jgi:predicted nucleic acid-binding protein